MSEPTETLVDRARVGDNRAFGELVRRFQRRVYATAYRMTSCHEDADDIAQEAFVRAFRGLARFDRRSEFFTWLYRIVVNVALNHHRRESTRERRAVGGVIDEQSAGNQGDPQHQVELGQLAAHVELTMNELSSTLRISLVLVVLDGLSYRQAAAILDCSEGTVAWRVHEARRQLRRKLSGYLTEGTHEEVRVAGDHARPGGADVRR